MDIHQLRAALDIIHAARNHEDGMVRLCASHDVPPHLLTHLATEVTSQAHAKIGIYPASGYAHRLVIDLVRGLIAEITRTDDATLHSLPLAHLMAWLVMAETRTGGDLRDLIETFRGWQGVTSRGCTTPPG